MDPQLYKELLGLVIVVLAATGLYVFMPSKAWLRYRWMFAAQRARRAVRFCRAAFDPDGRRFLRYADRLVDLEQAMEIKDGLDRMIADRLDDEERSAARDLPEAVMVERALEKRRAAAVEYLASLGDEEIAVIARHVSERTVSGAAPADHVAAFFRGERRLLAEQPYMVATHLDRLTRHVNAFADLGEEEEKARPLRRQAL